MCKLLDHIVKLIASMYTRRLGRVVDDGSHHYREPRGIPAPSRPSREQTTRSARTPEMSEISPHGRATSPVPRVRSGSVHTGSRTQLPRDTQDLARVERDSTDSARKRVTTPPGRDQDSMYSKEAEGSGSRDEVRQSREEGRRRYDEDRTGDTLGTKGYPSFKESADIHHPPLAHAKDTESGVCQTSSLQHLLEAKSREASDLQHELRKLVKEKKTLTDLYTNLQLASDEREKKLSTMHHERQAALERKKDFQNAYTALGKQYDELCQKFNAICHEHKDALEQKQKDYADLARKYEVQTNEHHALSNRYQSLKATLEQRTSELQGVQKFLSTADTFSGSEVVNMLRRLNEEVNQNARFMVEWSVENLAFETPNPDQATAQTVEQTRSSNILGTRLMDLLGSRMDRDNPILVEMAFRAYLIYELYVIASPWSIGQEEESHNQYIDAIYQRMRETEGQAISGNWRALTRAYALPACLSDPEFAWSFVTTIVSGFSDILLAAGCMTPREDITATLWSKFAEKIHHFISLAGQVNKIIGVGVISEDFEVTVVWPGTVFEEKTMEDADDIGDRMHGVEEHQEVVLCATEMGLIQRMKAGGIGGGDKAKQTELTVIKPKVTLASVLNALVE